MIEFTEQQFDRLCFTMAMLSVTVGVMFCIILALMGTVEELRDKVRLLESDREVIDDEQQT